MIRIVAVVVSACGEPTRLARDAQPAPSPDAGSTWVEADGLLFFNGHGEAPIFVPHRNPVAVDVPLSAGPTGGFRLYGAPRSGFLVPGPITLHTRVFDATGTRELGRSGRGVDAIMFDDTGWSASELDYAIAGACRGGAFLDLEPPGPFIVRIEAVDQLRTGVQAEVLVQPSCAIANGSTDPARTPSEDCLAHCPGF